MGIPLGTLTPKPRTQPEQPKLPTIDSMQGMVAAGLEDIVKQLIEQHKLPLKIENGKLVDALKGTELYLNRFITRDEACIQMKQTVMKLAKCPDEVLITGDTGTGKEIIARAMIGDRSGNFVAINCAGLPEYLIESELFGHERGSFTGAESTKQGLCAVAKDGVLFLDEIGELPVGVQAKLLRAIQDKKVRRVGGNKEEDISCKFVCATHRDIRQMVADKLFREDLYARISTFELHIPSLKDRPTDVEAIILTLQGGQKFLEALRQADYRISDLDLTYNVRSLQRAVKRFDVLNTIILS